ncbi:hypothetical protein HDU67_005469, partial [Dinochytrium kinnereticum]
KDFTHGSNNQSAESTHRRKRALSRRPVKAAITTRRELILEPVGGGTFAGAVAVRVRGGTVEKLVERLWGATVLDEDYMTAFILTHRTFTLSDIVMESLHHCRVETSVFAETSASRPVLPFLRFLGLWAGLAWEDFSTNEPLRRALKSFLETSGTPETSEAYHIQTFLTQRLTDTSLTHPPLKQNTHLLREFDHQTQGYPDSLTSLIQAYVLADKEALALQITEAEAGRFIAIERHEMLMFAESKTKNAEEFDPNIRLK